MKKELKDEEVLKVNYNIDMNNGFVHWKKRL